MSGPGRLFCATALTLLAAGIGACGDGGGVVDRVDAAEDTGTEEVDGPREPADAGTDGGVGEEDGPTQPPDAAAGDVAAPAFTCPAARALEDAPDDEPDLYQVRALYVLPSDGTDEQLDTDGRICRSLQAAMHWMVAQTRGSRLRFDTAGGAVDVGFVRLARTDAEMRGSGGTSIEDGYAYLRDRIERELARMELLQPKKLYAVYYGGGSPFSCGGGAWPPALPGRVAALYLGGEPPGAPPCRGNPVGASATRPGYVEYSLVHEVMHTLGLVGDGAPNQHAAGHVFDPGVAVGLAARDLMYAQRSGADPGWGTGSADGLVLDIGQDDYFGHQRPELPDLSRSVFLTPLPDGAVPPPRW
jgi:hypothetical protein